MSRIAAKHAGRLTLVSKIVSDANLFAPPPKRRAGQNGRPAVKGRSLSSPEEAAKSGVGGKKMRVRWYGGGWRNVKVFTGVGCWYKSGKGIVTIRGWSQGTVITMAPCLFLLSTIVVLFYDTMPARSAHIRKRHWAGKESVALSDMIISVRHHLSIEWVFAQVPGGGAVQKLPPPIRKLVNFGLTQAA